MKKFIIVVLAVIIAGFIAIGFAAKNGTGHTTHVNGAAIHYTDETRKWIDGVDAYEKTTKSTDVGTTNIRGING